MAPAMAPAAVSALQLISSPRSSTATGLTTGVMPAFHSAVRTSLLTFGAPPARSQGIPSDVAVMSFPSAPFSPALVSPALLSAATTCWFT